MFSEQLKKFETVNKIYSSTNHLFDIFLLSLLINKFFKNPQIITLF